MRALIAGCICALAALPATADDGALKLARPADAGHAGHAIAKSSFLAGLPREAPPPRAPLGYLKPGGACGSHELEVCLDANGRITVPRARHLLPAIPGLKPERLSVRRNGVVLSYSF
ncbi:MAG TPA: hypothetical protein PLK52_11225 [Usitatibacteraceae bacterium]|jgi:hypothetical protein|nr:hypothetical protein [Usitatibacteraceae bacterium]